MSNTQDLARFGYREKALAAELLTLMLDQGLPDDFTDQDVTVEFNPNSGYVFLTNCDYQAAMAYDGKLESFYYTPYAGHEGFYDELVTQCFEDENWHEEDIEFLIELATYKEDDATLEKLKAQINFN